MELFTGPEQVVEKAPQLLPEKDNIAGAAWSPTDVNADAHVK